MGIFEQFGVRPVINAAGAVTRLGGAPMPDAVLQAYCEAARDSVPLDEMQAAASRVISQTTGAEAGLVTTGAASALTLGTAAMLCGYDIARMERLPHVDGAFPDELIVAREHRSGYDHAARAAGARLVEVGFHEIVANAGVRRVEAWEYAAAIGPRTAGVLYGFSSASRPPLTDVVAVAHERGLPVLVDAAGELPPRENLRRIVGTAADLVAFSGGKSIRGPQSTGILCGRRDLIASAALQMLDMDDHFELWSPPADFIDKSKLRGLPRHGIGRAHKVAKEQIAALLTALRAFCSGAYDDDVPRMRALLEDLAAGLKDCAVQLHLQSTPDTESLPSLEIVLDGSRLDRSAFDVCHSLRGGEPAVYVGQMWLDQGKLVIHPLLLRHDQLPTLVSRLRAALQPGPQSRNDETSHSS